MVRHPSVRNGFRLLLGFFMLGEVSAQAAGTTFTFQGQLRFQQAPINDTCDLQFKLFDALTAGHEIGTMQTQTAVPFANGLFTVQLDFGASAFPGADRWLQIDIGCPAGSGSFTTISDRQPVTTVPYAIRAMSANVLDAPGGGSANALFVDPTGRIGIGTTTPKSQLDVRGFLTLDDGSNSVLFTAASGGEQNRYLKLFNSPDFTSASGLKAGGILVSNDYAYANPGKNDLVVKGTVAIGGIGAGAGSSLSVAGKDALKITGVQPFITLEDENVIGLQPPQYRLQMSNGDFDLEHYNGCALDPCPAPTFDDLVHVDPFAAKFRVGDFLIGHPSRRGTPGRALVDNGVHGLVVNFGGDWSTTTIGSPLVVIGQTSTQVLQITGGGDIAEPFRIGSKSGTVLPNVEPGMVVVIDPDHPGDLEVSRRAYDRTVAGVISGAKGLAPGVVMTAGRKSDADGDQPVALTGRVWTYCDAQQTAIAPGDLLTTSGTPGHAMKVTDHARAQGATIGKAMTPLARGAKGLVLTLVTLQ